MADDERVHHKWGTSSETGNHVDDRRLVICPGFPYVDVGCDWLC